MCVKGVVKLLKHYTIFNGLCLLITHYYIILMPNQMVDLLYAVSDT